MSCSVVDLSLHCCPHHDGGCGHDHHDHNEHGHEHGHHHGHGRRKPPRPAILLAAFGVALADARQGYELIETEVRERFPGVPVAWAYTAHKVRRKLAARGQIRDSVAVALSRLHDDGVTHLAVQSLHTVPGVEYHWTRAQAMAYLHPRKGFQDIVMGAPLLAGDGDLTRACQALGSYIPSERLPEEAVVLVGHGTYHEGQQRYLDYEACIRQDDPHVFLGALMGRPGDTLGISTVIGRLQSAGMTRCWLAPFMSVPGHHVQVDVLGDSPSSWKNRLHAAGIEVLTRATGTLEHAPFRALWMEHLCTAFAALRLESAAPALGHNHHADHADHADHSDQGGRHVHF